MAETQRDITRTFLAVLFIGALLGTSLWILKPFLGAAIWAVTIVTATWPLMISHPGPALGPPIAGSGGDDRGPSLRPGGTSVAGHRHNCVERGSDNQLGEVAVQLRGSTSAGLAGQRTAPQQGFGSGMGKGCGSGDTGFREKTGPIWRQRHAVVHHGGGWLRGLGFAIPANRSICRTYLRQR